MGFRSVLNGVAGILGALALGVVALEPGASAGDRSGHVHVLAHEPSEMVFVGSGSFAMGMPDGEEELRHFIDMCRKDFRRAGTRLCLQQGSIQPSQTPREVQLDSFSIDRREVVVGDYRKCVRTGACEVDPLLFGDQRYHKSEWPVVNVRWDDAVAYCRWRGKRLPTEAEWEKAARGPKSLRYPWGKVWIENAANHGSLNFLAEMSLLRAPPDPAAIYDLFFPGLHGQDDSDGHAQVSAPGSMIWGASPYGAEDMAGNVAEWVADYYSPAGYDGLPRTNPVRQTPDKEEKSRVVRGGSWRMPRVLHLSYLRHARPGGERTSDLGFRCAQDR